MIMALNTLPSIDDYWSSNPALQNQLISRTMSIGRFKLIQRYFHVNDPLKDPTRLKNKDAAKEALQKDPLYKISPLMEKVRMRSMDKYNLHQELSVDEAMIKCHGQHKSIVGAPNKPAKRGFKIFVLADRISGYLWNFQVYLRRQKEVGLTQRVIENLTEPTCAKNHIVFVDKFYTSIPLAISLLDRDIHLCGSFNTGRKFWPADLKLNKSLRKRDDKIRNLERGDSITRQSADGKLVATVWMDTKPVFNISTCYSTITNARKDKVERRIRTKEGKYQKQEFSCPNSIVEFNKYMGGVDRHDHLRSSYTLQRASTKWWTYFAWFAVDMALINSYLIFKEDHPRTTHKGFQLKVAEQLLGGYCERLRQPRQNDQPSLSAVFADNHETVVLPGRARACRFCSKMKIKNESGRTRETTYGCAQCGVSLHRECFLPYHRAGIKENLTRDVATQFELLKTPTKVREESLTKSQAKTIGQGGKPAVRKLNQAKSAKRCLNVKDNSPVSSRKKAKCTTESIENTASTKVQTRKSKTKKGKPTRSSPRKKRNTRN